MTIISTHFKQKNALRGFKSALWGILLCSLLFSQAMAATYKVNTKEAYEKARSKVVAGDTIVLKNGVWRDFEILFEGQGTVDKPITLTAETKGKVIISGLSNLRLSGEHLIVSGLVFKHGHTPTSAVISYQKDKHNLANNSRVTDTVIDNFSNPERYEVDYWVAIYGKNNRFDHNHLEGKSNKGVTLAVRLNTPQSQQNNHRIDHNYFGPRSVLGSNGGETLRVGTSHYSLTNSFTVVENNYFDRCDGELEIISNKAGNNVIRGNVFYQSRGTLTLRHGNDTLVENNVFFGNGADHTGGIRVINKRQTIKNNYLEGLAGYRFGGALVIMNGVPNSKINRYHQVEDSVVENNTLVNSDHIQLAAGSDFERSAVPIRTHFKRNLIQATNNNDPFTIYDDISGITFDDNVINNHSELQIKTGFTQQAFELTRADNGLLYPNNNPQNLESVGVSRSIKPIKKTDVGVSWYPKPNEFITFDHGKRITVKPGLDTIHQALEQAKDGDVLILNAGEYAMSRILVLNKAVTLAAKVAGEAKITFQRTALFEIHEGGNLKLDGVVISGAESPDSSGNSVIRTQRKSMLSNYQLIVKNSRIVDLDINHSFNFLSVFKGTFADRIEILDSHFKDVTGAILSLSQENDDYGIYNAEYVVIKNSSFSHVGGDLVDYYRGGTDESTFGPHFNMSGSTLINVGLGKRNKSKSAITLHGVQVTTIENNKITNSLPLRVFHTVGEPVTKIQSNIFTNTPVIEVQELYSDQENTANLADNLYQSKK